MNRRNFLATSLATSSIPFIAAKGAKEDKKVRLAFIGVGLRGRNHVEQSLFLKSARLFSSSSCFVNLYNYFILFDNFRIFNTFFSGVLS